MKKTFWDSQDTNLLCVFFLASFDHQKTFTDKRSFLKMEKHLPEWVAWFLLKGLSLLLKMMASG